MVFPPGLLKNNLRMVPSTTACTGVPLGAGRSIASWGCPEWISLKVSRTLAGLRPSMGSPISGGAAPIATATANTNHCPARFPRCKLFLRHYRSANNHHMRQIDRVPVCQPDASVRFALPDAPGIIRSVDSIVFLREPHPYHADWVSRSRWQLLCRFV